MGGSFRAVAVRGEPGIGKSWLLAELAGRAKCGDIAVYSGRATEFEQDVPFGVFIDAFERLGPAGPGPQAHGSEPLAVLAAAATGQAGHQLSELDRYQLFRGVRGLLELRAGPGTVLILDDLHWADPSSLQLTEYLLRRPPRARLLIALAHRTAQPPPGLADALAHLGSAAVQLALEPLTPEDIAALFPNAPVRRHRLLHRATRGNPLYLNTLAEVDDATLTTLIGQWMDDRSAPERVLLDVLSAEIKALAAVSREVAQASAVAGDPADPDLVAWVADISPASLVAAFDELSRTGVMVAEGPRFRFRHPLVRAAAYWIAPPAWRTRAHARCARYLRDRRGSLLMLAHHTERSAEPGDGVAVETLAEAALASQHASPATAARLVGRALQLLPDRPALAQRRGELRMLLAKTLGLCGELTQSRELLQAVIDEGGPHRTDAVTFLAMIYRLLGMLDEASALLTSELHTLPATGEPTAKVLVELAGVEVLRHDIGQAHRHAARAVDVGAGTTLEFAAHTVLSLGFLQTDEIAGARAHIDRAAWLMDATADASMLTELATVAPLAWVELHLQHQDRAARHLSRAIELATGRGLTHSMPYLLIVDACVLTRRGRVAEAIVAGDEAREYAQIMNATETAAMADVIRLRPILWRHGPATALRLADRVAGAGRPGMGWWAALARLNLAEVYLAAGRLEDCLTEVHSGPPDPATTTQRMALAAVALSRLGRLDESLAHAAEALEHAEHTALTHQLGVAHEARARSLAATGDLDAATADAAAAVALFLDAEAPIEEATTRHLLATLHAKAGRSDDLAAELGRAKALYSAGSALWLSTSLARDGLRLAAHGPRSRRATGAGLATLTTREREIVELVIGGMTNREIAERLYLSKKTVETHLSRAYAKLDVRSRVDLTRRIAR